MQRLVGMQPIGCLEIGPAGIGADLADGDAID
jgi:hypothetical protein